MVNYPMTPSMKMFSIFNDSILNAVFATINNTNYLYTGTMDGLIIEWLEVGLNDYIPNRVNFNLAGNAIKDIILLKRQTLLVQNIFGLKQNIYLPSSLLTDCYQLGSTYNITTAC